MAFKRPLPEWNNPGVEPPKSKKDMGWLGREKPPAQWHNWFQHLTYEALKELQENAAHVTFGNTQPASPDVNDLWVDTSEEPPILKRFDGTRWMEIGKGGVSSVNGKTGDVVLTAEDVGAASNDALNAHLNENVLLGDTPHGWVYEEGAFTPYLQPLEGAFANIEYSEQTGYYVRNGNLVWVYVHLSVNGTTLDVGTASGHLRIAGLPYVLKGDAPYQFSSVPRSFRWNTDDRTLGMYGRGFPGTAIIGLYKQLRPNDDILIAQEEITVAHLRQSSDPFINILAFSFQYLI